MYISLVSLLADEFPAFRSIQHSNFVLSYKLRTLLTFLLFPSYIIYTFGSTSSIPTSENVPAFTNEQFWFEMRKSTGGSRNILDLSKLGQIESGSVKGTPYEHSDPARMYGGIKFFDIDPEDTSRQKNITINYLGKDYYVLSLLDESELDRIKSLSRVWARNGSSATSKAYGML